MGTDRNGRRGNCVTGEHATGLTVLLAEDEAGVRQMVGNLLRSNGYTVLEAADGLEALERAEQHPGPIHVLLTDLRMPRLDGGELIRKLSLRRPETAIVVMSGYAHLEPFHVEPFKATLLRKPFKPEDVVNTINEVVGFGSKAIERNGIH